MDSPHDRLGVVLETAMIALMNDSSSGALGFVPPIPPSRPHAGKPYLAWKQANSSAMRREPAVSAHMDGCPIRPRWRRVSSSCPVHKERRRELVLMKLSYRVICETACRVREYNSSSFIVDTITHDSAARSALRLDLTR